jgi:hypothetical protein
MAVSPATRFEAARAALTGFVPQIAPGQVKLGVDELVEMLVERIRPTAGRSVTLGPGDVAELKRAAREKGPDVEELFRDLLKNALEGTIQLGGQSAPVLLLEDAAREQLANFAGVSSVADHTVRGSLAAHAEVDKGRINEGATDRMFVLEQLRMDGRKGLAAGAKKETSTPLAQISAGIREAAASSGRPSVAGETLEALGPRIDEAVSAAGMALWNDEKVRGALTKLVTDPKQAKALLPSMCRDAGGALSTVLGCKLVNDEVVKKGLQLLPSVGKRLGIEGIEQCAENIGKVLLKEGAEEVVKTGAKQGVKKGVMGLLSSIPLANVIPMLFTGAEMLGEFTKEKPDKRTLGKGLATFALQLGAIAFPPLGLAATAVDLTGSVAIAVSDSQKAGLSKSERQSRAEDAISRRDERSLDMAAAIDSNAHVVSQALTAIERSMRDLGSGERADLARDLAERTKNLRSNPGDENAAKELHQEIGRFSFDALLPEIVDQVKRMKKRDPEDASNWSLMAEALEQIGASVVGVRSDPERNEPKMKMLLSAILKAGVAGSALAGEASYPANRET